MSKLKALETVKWQAGNYVLVVNKAHLFLITHSQLQNAQIEIHLIC